MAAPTEIRLRVPVGWRLTVMVGTPVPWMGAGLVLMCLRDLVELRRFAATHNREKQIRAVLRNAAIVTMLVVPDGPVLPRSGLLSRMHGHDTELLEGRPLVNLVSADDCGTVMNAMVCAVWTGRPASHVTVMVGLLKIGEALSIPFELSIGNLVDGPTVGDYVITGHDVPDRKRPED